jgi:hypothetical protein
MALNYYTSIDLNQNQLLRPRIENLVSDPSGVEGQLYFNTNTDKLRVYAGGAWVNIDTDTDTGITGVTLATGSSTGAPLTESITGRELTLTSMAYAGGSNIGYVPAGGTASKVLLGNGTWGDYQSGDVTGIDAGLGIVVNDPTTATPEVAVDYAGANNVIASAADGTGVTLADSDDFLFLDGDNNVKYGNMSQIKTYIGTPYSGWISRADSGSDDTIQSGDVLDFETSIAVPSNNTYFETVQSANKVTFQLNVTTNTNANTIVGRDGSGNITAVGGTMNLIGGSNGSRKTIGQFYTLNDGVIATTQASGNDTTLVATTAFVQDAVSGLVDSWTIAGDSGSSSVDNGQTVTIAGSTGIDTTESGRTVTVDLDLNEVATITDYDAAADHIVVVNGGANAKTLSTNIPLNDWGIPNGNVAMGTNGGTLHNIIDLKDPVNLQDAATKNYVDTAVTGLLEFKGGFNASTGEITSGSNSGSYLWGGSRVAIATGDLYIAAGSASGNFFGNSAYPLTPGDSVYAVTAAAANQSVVTDFAVAQSDTDLATAGANAGAATIGISSYDSDNFSVNTGFVSISNVTLGTETTGNYTATVAESAANNRLGIDVSGATGEGQAAVVGLDIVGQTALTAAAADDALLIYDKANTTNKKIDVSALAGKLQDTNSFATTVTLAAGVAQAITHSGGTGVPAFGYDVMVQCYDATNYETIIVNVDRTSTTQITLTADTAPPNDVRVLVQNIVA